MSMKNGTVATCHACDNTITRNNKSGMCSCCKYNNEVTITTTKIKKEYLLTNEELDGSGIYSFKAQHGKRYIIEDVEELTEVIYKEEDSDRKKKYIANREKRRREKKVEKYKDEIIDEEYRHRFVFDEEDPIVNQYINGSDEVDIYEYIADEYETMLENKKREQERKIEIEICVSSLPKKQKNYMKHHPVYSEYIKDPQLSLDETKQLLLDQYEARNRRRGEIIKKLEEKGMKLRGDSKLCD